MKFFEEKIPDKPIYYEMRQQARRFLSSSMKGNQIASLIVIISVFSITVYAFMVSSKYLHVSIPVMFLPMVISIVLPGVMGGLISGEMQKRSMESLLATPLTTGQLVIAKALRAIMPVMATLGAILVLILILLVGKLFYGDDSGDDFLSGWIAIPCGILVYLVFSFAVTGICLAVSAVTRSAVASLVGSFGLLVLIYVILPAIVVPIYMAIVGQSGNQISYLAALHPYGMVALTTVVAASKGVNMVALVIMFVIGFGIQGLIGFLGLAFAASRLENLKKKGIEG